MKFGKNEIQLETENCTLNFILFYHDYRIDHVALKLEMTKSKLFRVFYVICDDDMSNGEFQSPKHLINDCNSALKRISLAVRLLQTYLSECTYKRFGTRKTIRFANDFSEETPHVCEVYRTKLKLNEAHKMKENELFIYLANEIKSRADFNLNHKYLLLMSFTRYDSKLFASGADIFESTKGFCALGDRLIVN